MRFERDLFISYAHIDNRPLSPEQQGWISRFHTALEALLSMRLGHDAHIWRDSKLAGNDVFGDEIIAQFPKTAVLLTVLSPRYVESEWCTREVQEFCKVAQQSAGLAVENKSRIVKILKLPIESDDPLPPVMRSLLGYQFYHLDEDNTPLELDPLYGAEMAQKYNVRMAKLAWEIANVLKLLAKLESDGPSASPAPQPSRGTLYLAECSYDRRDAREAIDAELRCHGYRVLPERPLPRDEEPFVAEVRNLLSQSSLSIHLIGATGGAVPDGPSQKSIVALQNEIATALSHENGLRRIIWLPEGTSSRQQEHDQFIRRLQTDVQAQFGADLITSPQQEAIKGAIHAALQSLRKTAASASVRTRSPGPKLIYLICDSRDTKATLPLRKLLIARGYEVKLPIFEGDAATIRQASQDLLEQSAGVVVFYGEGGEAWKYSVDSEIRKFLGARSNGQGLPVFTCLAAPETAAKRDMLDLEQPNLLNCLPAISGDAIQPFLQALEADTP